MKIESEFPFLVLLLSKIYISWFFSLSENLKWYAVFNYCSVLVFAIQSCYWMRSTKLVLMFGEIQLLRCLRSLILNKTKPSMISILSFVMLVYLNYFIFNYILASQELLLFSWIHAVEIFILFFGWRYMGFTQLTSLGIYLREKVVTQHAVLCDMIPLKLM